MAAARRRRIQGAMVEIADMRNDDRGLELADYNSRALLQHEIHELILTKEAGIGKGSAVSKVTYAGFFEVLLGGMARLGDEVWFGDGLDQRLGSLVGFDLTHTPNHYNIVLSAKGDLTGEDLGLTVGTPLCFQQA